MAPGTVWTEACLLLQNPKVAKRVEWMRQQIENVAVVSVAFIKMKLLDMVEDGSEPIQLGALKELGKLEGYHQHNVKHTMEGAINHRHLHLDALKTVNYEFARKDRLLLANSQETSDVK